MAEDLFIGVDVGTGSVRVCMVNSKGKILEVATKDIQTYNPLPDHYEQSSEEIWSACCSLIKQITRDISTSRIKGIGFDATCSLVAVDHNGNPVSVSTTGEPNQNIILWMDHRANEEADFINTMNHECLEQVGGKISLEMEVPKLLWLKRNLSEQCWRRVHRFFDLPDYLTWKASGADSRSLCSVVCKWLYMASAEGGEWNSEFFNQIELDDLSENYFCKIGNVIKTPGEPCGSGLSEAAAKEMDLVPGIAVATSIIDAHAGGLGLIGCNAPSISQEFSTRISLICGTSTCLMAVNHCKLRVKGIWGPYFSAMVPGMWLNEAGQSATGKLLDHIIDTHPAAAGIREKIGVNVFITEYLNRLLEEMAREKSVTLDELTKEVHMVPDFHGNRSPLADHTFRGMICGLDLNSGEHQLAIIYLATLQALAYGTRHIIEVLQEEGYQEFQSILVCGGLSKNRLFVRMHANVTAKSVLIPHEAQSVLLGSAILAATASKRYPSIATAVTNMAGNADIVKPDPLVFKYHERKYSIFRKMLNDQREYQNIMNGFSLNC